MGAEGKDSGRFEPIDLSSLESLDIEPAWAKKSSPPNYEQKGTSHRLEGRKPGRNEKNPAQRKGSRYPPRQKAENQFTFSIQPKGEVLQKIKEEMRRTGVSFGLSEICATISGSPQRYNVIIRFSEERDGQHFATTKVDGKVFSSKEKAIRQTSQSGQRTGSFAEVPRFPTDLFFQTITFRTFSTNKPKAHFPSASSVQP